MPTIDQFSTSNIINSLSVYLAGKLLASGYLVYWHYRDFVQTTDGAYYQYSTNASTYLADPTFVSRYSTAKALVTLTDSIPADPRHIVRPTTDGSVGPPETVTVPVLSISVGDAVPIANYEVGTALKWRTRHLVIDGFARTKEEAAALADLLAIWFDEDLSQNILNHDAGSLAVIGSVRIANMRSDRDEWLDEAEERRFEMLLNAMLEYVA